MSRERKVTIKIYFADGDITNYHNATLVRVTHSTLSMYCYGRCYSFPLDTLNGYKVYYDNAIIIDKMRKARSDRDSEWEGFASALDYAIDYVDRVLVRRARLRFPKTTFNVYLHRGSPSSPSVDDFDRIAAALVAHYRSLGFNVRVVSESTEFATRGLRFSDIEDMLYSN